MAGWVCTCGARNRSEWAKCVGCQRARPEDREAPVNAKPSECVVCQVALDARGYCPLGDGYPLVATCPDVCPRCRIPLSWAGLCRSCSRTGGEAPGHRYELHENGHWKLVSRGPSKLLTVEQNQRCLDLVKAVLALEITEEQARTTIDAIARNRDEGPLPF